MSAPAEKTGHQQRQRTGQGRKSLALAAALSFGTLGVAAAPAVAAESIVFNLQVSPGAAPCLPNAKGRVTITNNGGLAENLHVEVYNLKPNTDYDLFLIQVPNAPFGLSWYQGDIETDAHGLGVGDFVGRFSVETFIVAPGSATVPRPVHPKDAHAGTLNPAIPAPIHTYHMGVWFNSPTDAAAVGCPNTTTPFNGDHTAGIQVLNTGAFAPDRGPLFSFRP